MTRYELAIADLQAKPVRWLVTGAAGFIGSHLCETLLKNSQEVVGIDNLSTGSMNNIEDLLASLPAGARSRFTFINGDICDRELMNSCCQGCVYVLHQAALGSVPRSMIEPIETTRANVEGSISVFVAAVAAQVKSVVYASSSSVYGDNEDGVKLEERIGTCLSPYAASKRTVEIYAGAFARGFSLRTVGLRYFNVFGPRQNPNGAYAAVIPKWLSQLVNDTPCQVYGDGLTSRDFCNVQNVVQANILAAICSQPKQNAIYNIALGGSTSLIDLYSLLAEGVWRKLGRQSKVPALVFSPPRSGDIRHSLASIDSAKGDLGYEPTVPVKLGLERLIDSIDG